MVEIFGKMAILFMKAYWSYQGADKFLTRSGRKQATSTKL